jgi:ribosomal protein S18 acetylase RimI-like enzyme
MIIENASLSDLTDIVSLQKMAFQSEAELFNDYSIAPFTQSIESIGEDFKSYLYVKAVSNGEILGSVRACEEEHVCHIGRLFVHPDHQNRGVGKALMLHIERLFNNCGTYSLFCAKRVSKNLSFYKKLGYGVVREETVTENLIFVYFSKDNR